MENPIGGESNAKVIRVCDGGRKLELSNLEREILSFGTDDVFGLWEIVGFVRMMFPDANEQALVELAKPALERLLREGLVRLVHFDRTTNGDKPIPTNVALGLLHDPASWMTPRQEEPWELRYINTSEGDRVYFALEPLDSKDPMP